MKPGGRRLKTHARAQSVLTQGGVVLNCVASKTTLADCCKDTTPPFSLYDESSHVTVHEPPAAARRALARRRRPSLRPAAALRRAVSKPRPHQRGRLDPPR